jgi:hypothetical protein
MQLSLSDEGSAGKNNIRKATTHKPTKEAHSDQLRYTHKEEALKYCTAKTGAIYYSDGWVGGRLDVENGDGGDDDESDNDAEDVADDSDIASLDQHAIRLPWVIVRSK